jgi:hypothetical protein
MGKKRRALSAPQKHRVRARILGVNNRDTTSNSEAIEALNASNNTTVETPTVETTPEPVVTVDTTPEATQETTAPEPVVATTTPKTTKTTRTRTTAKKKTTRTRRTTTKKTDSSEA